MLGSRRHHAPVYIGLVARLVLEYTMQQCTQVQLHAFQHTPCNSVHRSSCMRFRRHRAIVYTGPALHTRSMSDPRCCAGVGDLERSLARLNAAGLGGGMGRDAMKVVLYEDNAKRRVAAMIAGLRGLQTLNKAFKGFQAVLPTLASGLLQQLLTPGRGFPELDGPLEALEGATDWHEAAASGRATPRRVCMSPCSQCLFPLMAMPATLHPVLCFGFTKTIMLCLLC